MSISREVMMPHFAAAAVHAHLANATYWPRAPKSLPPGAIADEAHTMESCSWRETYALIMRAWLHADWRYLLPRTIDFTLMTGIFHQAGDIFRARPHFNADDVGYYLGEPTSIPRLET